MFDHPGFIKYSFEDIPLDTDIFLMEEKWLKEYENSWLKTFEGGENENVGYIGYAAARKVSATAADLSWYPNIFTRFHEVRISLPRDQFIVCVEIKDYDGKPHIFVKNEW